MNAVVHGHDARSRAREPSGLVVSYLTLRKVIGFLGLALPSVLILGHLLVVHWQVLPSISAYYYSELNPLFIGILCTIAAFLLSYQGYERSDHVASVLAGLGCLAVALLPCGRPDDVPTGPVSRWMQDLPMTTPHYLGAALFLASLAYISLFEFTKSAGAPTRQKLRRNRVYRGAGWVMVACLAVMGSNGVLHLATGLSFLPANGILVGETVSVVAFAVSWLTKGEWILKDEARP